MLKNARFDKESQKVVISIPDPNLLIEIQNYVEKHGGYIATQFNRKLLQIRIEYFIELAVLVNENEYTTKETIKLLKKHIKDSNKNETIFDENNIGKSLLDAGVNITSIIANITTILGADNPIAKAVFGLFQ